MNHWNEIFTRSLHSHILIRLITTNSLQNHRCCRFWAILGWANQYPYWYELQYWFQPSRIRYPFLREFFFSACACSYLKIEEKSIPQVMIHIVMDARFFDSWVLYPFWYFCLSTRNALKHHRINYRVFNMKLTVQYVLDLVWKYVCTRLQVCLLCTILCWAEKKSSPKSELYCWFQSSRVWFPFLKDFFAGALANSNSKVEEKTNFQVMICTVLTLDSLNVYFHPHTRLNLWGLKMHNTIHQTNVNHYQVFVFSCCVSFFVEYEELWSSNS